MRWIKIFGFILLVAVATSFAAESLGITGEAGGFVGMVVGFFAGFYAIDRWLSVR